MELPLVSVVMPVYGVERYVGDAVRSVLAQSMQHFELIVVDDCTPDRSITVVESFGDARIRIVRHGRNLGLATARNTGIALARGSFIALLDSDDISPPQRLARQLELLEHDRGLIGCGGWMQPMDAGGQSLGAVHRSETEPDRIAPTLLLRNTFFVSSMMFRRQVFTNLKYSADFRMAEDYEFMVRASRLGRLGNVAEVLLHYRVHPTSLTSTQPQLMAECRRRIAADQLNWLGIESTPAELDAHMLAAIPVADVSRQQLVAVLGWLKRLSAINQARCLYPQTEFDDVLAASWFEACTVASGLGPWALARYFRGGLPGNANVPSGRVLKFAAKSLFKLRRESLRKGLLAH